MKRILILLVVGLLTVCTRPGWADQTAEEILKSVVKIRAIIPKDARTAETLGTEREGHGVLIDDRGYILTIGYLVSEAETIELTGPDDKKVGATFVGYDQSSGFGLVRAESSIGAVPMKIGDSSKVKEGEPVLVAGYGGKDAVQVARVISRREFAGYWEYLIDDAIFTAPVYANFGGAALIDKEGQLVGIGSLFTQVVLQGIGALSSNMFVPIDLLKPILNDLITLGHSREAPKPWLGINSEESHGRIFITKLTAGGPAEEAGLQVDDLVLAVDGKPVKGLADFYRKVWAVGKAGVDVPLSILRGTRVQDVKVHSGDRYQFLNLRRQKVL